MYTIFINEVPIFLTDNPENNKYKNFFLYKSEATIKMILNKIKLGHFKEVYIYHVFLDVVWDALNDYFEIEKAAGGLVKNQENETLFIYRLGKWDLPKGKMKKRESKKIAAIREVREECGLKRKKLNISIEKELQTTYHIFKRNKQKILKITYWYLMRMDYNGKLIPQKEEGITDVVFKNKVATKKALKNTYGNIKLLFDEVGNF